jgi:TonB family protein
VHDPVAEILHQRSALTGASAPPVVLSAILHALLIGGGVIVARLHPMVNAAAVMTIRFASPPLPAAQSFVEPAALPAAKAPPIEQPLTAPVKGVSPPKPDSHAVPLSSFGRSTKRGEEKPGQPPAAAPPSTVKSSAAAQPALPAVGTTGVTSLEGGDFPYTLYIDRMRTLIGTKWFRPAVKGDLVTRIYFVIDRDGTIHDARVESESGNGTFDRAALRAILEASPLPPLPFGYSGTYLGVRLIFH